jgi:hypothetical protein
MSRCRAARCGEQNSDQWVNRTLETGTTCRRRELVISTEASVRPMISLIAQLAVTAKMAALRTVASDRLGRTIDPATTHRDLGCCGNRMRMKPGSRKNMNPKI